MAIARKIAYNVVFNSTLQVVSTVFIALLSIRLVTGYLGQEGFGEYATVLAFFAFFGALGDLGLANMTAREIARPGADEPAILGKVAALRLLANILLLILAPIVLFFLHYRIEVKEGILIAVVALLFAQFSTFLNSLYQKRLAMDRVALVEFIGKGIQLGLIYTVVHFDLGFTALIGVLLANMAFNATVVFLLSRPLVKFSFHFDLPFWKTFLKDALPLGAMALISFLYFKMDTILLSLLQPANQVGIYNVAYKVMENLIFFPAMLVGLILPILSRAHHSNRQQFEDIAHKTAKVFCILVLPVVIGTVFLAPDIVRIVSGTGFEASAAVLQILAFSLAGIFFGHYFNMLILVGNVQKKLMYLLLGVALVNISLNLLLINKFSYQGAAVASAITELLVVAVSAGLVWKTLHFFPKPDRLVPILFSAAAMVLVMVLLSRTTFLLAGAGAVLTYIGGLWLFRAITPEELASVFSNRSEEESELALE
ncbi:flippase [Candidatus Dojkabacteria bacterium]|uniref:Flippase n=1 Tax=Candidatus Dojkabacteria bacterium TaxID=2099670 RepID=A0A5C7J9C7_9BACT|nr:MAG: flippase [Candidatus Dojkabacteria bacterium]